MWPKALIKRGSEAAPLAAGETVQADTLGVQVISGAHTHYLSEECQLATVSGRQELRSADVITCHVPRTQTKLGDRAFQVAGPRLWNSLPPSMRLPDIGPNEFKRLLKTHLFV